MTSLSYEAQLSPDELNQLHTALAEPGPNMLKIQASAPPWRDGPNAGSTPTLKTLYKIAAQLRAERLHAEFETTNQLWQAAQAELLGQGACAAASSQAINQIFSLICQEVIQRTLYRDDSKNRISLLRLLVRYQHLLLEKARFQRMAVEKFEAWYQNGPARQRLEELENATYAQRIEALGYAIFGEDWRPLVTSPVGIPGLEPVPTSSDQPAVPSTPPLTSPPPADNEPHPVNEAPPPETDSTIQQSNDSTIQVSNESPPPPANHEPPSTLNPQPITNNEPSPEPPIGLPANMEWLLTTPEDDAKRNTQLVTASPPTNQTTDQQPNADSQTNNDEGLQNVA